ncbi:uncharacterized protein BO80DRAFT_457046 [Aspergillus ibericus CBS 121593]|uniref:C2H2-type domain-containing protein n=1 Tax=Aspergillus ibericus CBS 121593 TaxID=1448316 RepID=A0A395GTE1_9EURO|nr:hypothetical protein BO80DRAFT_457046 [Aspergillus ibericus CBS 121593]RAK98696.1 hypothetical protein BO80DRAFT_457046 [Aspergillus ibericus CBS 121593]
MGCFANIIPLWKYITKFLGPIIFIGVERGPDDLVVTFLRGLFRDRLPWSDFKAIGQPAILAVARAGWTFEELNTLADLIREGRFVEEMLDRARETARNNRIWIHSRNSSEPTSHLQTQLDTFKEIIEKSRINYICPQCLKGFPRPDVLRQHFQSEKDDIHQGLAMKDTDFGTFYVNYQIAIKAFLPASLLRYGPDCFKPNFVVEHYKDDSEAGW